MELLKEFYMDEEGLGTVEMVVLLAVLVSIALVFREKVFNFVRNSLDDIFGDSNSSGGKVDTNLETQSK